MGIFLRKTAEALSVLLKWALLAAYAVLGLAVRTAGLLLLLFVLAVSAIQETAGITAGRR